MSEAPSPSLEPKYAPRSYLSYSTLLSFARCPRRYFYQKCGITLPEEPIALRYGTAMHKAVSFGMDALGQGKPLVAAMALAWQAFTSVWTIEFNVLYADPKRSHARAMQQLQHFLFTHAEGRSLYTLQPSPPLPDGMRLTEDVSPNELVGLIDIGLSVPLYARMDGWVRHRDTGKLWAYEFKTSSRMGASLFDGLDFNPQILTYVLVCRALVHQPIEGVMFEAMHIDAKKVDNMTHPVPVAEHLLDDALLWLRYVGEQLLACEVRAMEFDSEVYRKDPTLNGILGQAQSFPKAFSGCSAYPMFYQQGSQCEFMNLCRPADWRSMLPYYTIQPEHRPIELTIGAST